MIVADNVILTSGHCVLEYQNDAKYLVIIAGDHLKNVTEDTEQIMNVEKITVHADYDAYERNILFLTHL